MEGLILLIVTRAFAFLCVALLSVGFVAAQEKKPEQNQEAQQEKAKQQDQDSELKGLKEEDQDLIPQQYSFNPLQADKEVKVGDFYWKKKSYKAAAMRYEAATKWNPGMAEAYLKLGRVNEKLKDKEGAKKAYMKYLELAPDTSEARKLAKKYKHES